MQEQNNEKRERDGVREWEERKDVSGELMMAGDAATQSSDSSLTT